MEIRVVNKITIVNTFVHHIVYRKIMPQAIITCKTTKKMKNLICGMVAWKRALGAPAV